MKKRIKFLEYLTAFLITFINFQTYTSYYSRLKNAVDIPSSKQNRDVPNLAGIPYFLKEFNKFADIDKKKYPELAKFTNRYDVTEAFKDALEYASRTPKVKHLTDKIFLPRVMDLFGLERIRRKESIYMYDHVSLINLMDPLGTTNAYLKDFRFSRVLTAVRANKLIKEKKELADHIVIPQKGIAKVNGQWRVLAQKFEGPRPQAGSESSIKKISLKTAQALLTLMNETGISDLHNGNWKWTKDGKIALIDLDVSDASEFKDENMHNILVWFGEYMDQDAKTWFSKQTRNPIRRYFNHKKPPFSFRNYTDHDINFDKAETEFYDLLYAETKQQEELDKD